MNIALRAFWSNQPMPIQQKITDPDIILNISFGNVLTLKTGVTSINNKTGDVTLNAIDIGADSVGAARNVYDELSPKVDALIDNKLDKIDYVQHFRGLFSSYSALSSVLPTALDGDYAHIDSGSGFDRMCAIWDSDDTKWKIIETNITANTDEMPEGSHNLYFQSERVRQTVLTGLSNQTATNILATDNLITALAKLQAQISLSKQIWQNIENISMNIHNAVNKASSKLEVSNFKGDFYLKGILHTKEINLGHIDIFTLPWSWATQDRNDVVSFGLIFAIDAFTRLTYSFYFIQSKATNTVYFRCFSALPNNAYLIFNPVNIGALISP